MPASCGQVIAIPARHPLDEGLASDFDAAAAYDIRVESLADDLVLLSIRPANGKLAAPSRLRFGLMGSELVRLAASRRVDIVSDRIVVLDDGPTGDEQLDAALASLAHARRPPRPKAWVSHPRPRICDAYLARLAAAGTIRQERGTIIAVIPFTWWRITDAARAADARARLDAIVGASGQVDTWQAAFAGLASASGLGAELYPGWGNRQLRQRLDRIAKGKLTARVAADPGGRVDQQIADAALAASQAANDANMGAATQAATAAATQAATEAAIQAATQAATAAAIQAATQAATDAAVSAAVSAAHDAAGNAGGHGGAGAGGHH
jgi:hypothetical protein